MVPCAALDHLFIFFTPRFVLLTHLIFIFCRLRFLVKLNTPRHGGLYRWRENSLTLTSMGAELQSQNRVDINYEKTTSPIYLKF